MSEEHTAKVINHADVNKDEWMAMIAMVGTPSKVHDKKVEEKVNEKPIKRISFKHTEKEKLQRNILQDAVDNLKKIDNTLHGIEEEFKAEPNAQTYAAPAHPDDFSLNAENRTKLYDENDGESSSDEEEDDKDSNWTIIRKFVRKPTFSCTIESDTDEEEDAKVNNNIDDILTPTCYTPVFGDVPTFPGCKTPLADAVDGKPRLLPASPKDREPDLKLKRLVKQQSMKPAIKTPYEVAKNTFMYLQENCRMRATDANNYPRFDGFEKFSYILTGELGSVNMATTLLLSAAFPAAVLDCDGAGRSVPCINQITFVNKLKVSPTILMSPEPGPKFGSIASSVFDFPNGTEETVEEMVGTLISDPKLPFHPYCGYGTYVSKAEDLNNCAVFKSFTIAYEVGLIVEKYTKKDRALKISEALSKHGRPNEIVFHGVVTDKVLQDSNAKDIGLIEVTNTESKEHFVLWYKNEFILGGRKGEKPKYMAPDSICMIPLEGDPMDISTLLRKKDKVEVDIIVIEADEKMKEETVLNSFQNVYRVFKKENKEKPMKKSVYRGVYKEWKKPKSVEPNPKR